MFDLAWHTTSHIEKFLAPASRPTWSSDSHKVPEPFRRTSPGVIGMMLHSEKMNGCTYLPNHCNKYYNTDNFVLKHGMEARWTVELALGLVGSSLHVQVVGGNCVGNRIRSHFLVIKNSDFRPDMKWWSRGLKNLRSLSGIWKHVFWTDFDRIVS